MNRASSSASAATEIFGRSPTSASRRNLPTATPTRLRATRSASKLKPSSSDGPALGAVFEQLGYFPCFRYEKFRTEWSQTTPTIEGPLFSGVPDSADFVAPNPICHLVIDETPIGDYAELEGPPAWIDETLAKLGVDPDTCLTDSYGKLFLNWKQRTGSSAENLTFDEIPSSASAEVPQLSLR